MLTAILNGKQILATDPAWDGRKEEYRAFCKGAVCKHCQEPIICGFGEKNRHYFAHSRNNNCPGSNDTEEHMVGKEILYNFLMARYSQEANIELEYHIPILNTICDIFIEFNNGRKWAVEFYCGDKEQNLRNKIQYYKDNKIETTWLVSQSLYKEYIPGNSVKLNVRERLLINNKTGIDKLYTCGNWHEQICVMHIRRSLPRDRDDLGSIMYLDFEQKELRILRALESTAHVTIYDYVSLLHGPLNEIRIKFKKKDGVNWYFEQEKELWGKYSEAEAVLKEFPVIDLSEYVYDIPRHTEYERKENKKKEYAPPNSNNKDSAPHNNSQYPSGWNINNFVSPNYRYRCAICKKEYDQANMATCYPNMPEIEGTCRECSREMDRRKRV